MRRIIMLGFFHLFASLLGLNGHAFGGTQPKADLPQALATQTNQVVSVEEVATVTGDAGWSGPTANADANSTDDQQASSGGQQHTVEEITKLKQNPVSGLKSVFLQTVNVPIGSGTAESFSVQPVWPFKLGEGWRLVTYNVDSLAVTDR